MKIASVAHAFTTGVVVLATLASVASLRMYSQEQTPAQRSANHAGALEASRRAQATRVERAPKVDGTLDDPEWQLATLVLTGYAAQTRTPGFTAGQTDLGAGVNYQNSWLEVFGQHRKVGPNFNPEVGFLERNDCICDYADVNFKPRPKLRGVRGRSHHGDGLQTQHDAWALLWLALRAENDSYRFGDRQMFLDEL